MSIQKLAAAAWVTKTLGPGLFPQRAQETWDESPWALPHSGCGLQGALGAQLDPRPVPTARCLAAVPAEALASSAIPISQCQKEEASQKQLAFTGIQDR